MKCLLPKTGRLGGVRLTGHNTYSRFVRNGWKHICIPWRFNDVRSHGQIHPITSKTPPIKHANMIYWACWRIIPKTCVEFHRVDDGTRFAIATPSEVNTPNVYLLRIESGWCHVILQKLTHIEWLVSNPLKERFVA